MSCKLEMNSAFEIGIFLKHFAIVINWYDDYRYLEGTRYRLVYRITAPLIICLVSGKQCSFIWFYDTGVYQSISKQFDPSAAFSIFK